MTPDQFLTSLKKNGPAHVYLFLGPEPYQRERCRNALVSAVLGDAPEDRESGFTRVDLSTTPLAAAFDDARAMSLFATRRVIWIGSAEAVLPRGRAAQGDDDGVSSADAGPLADYLREPTPGTVVVLEVSRYGFEGDAKKIQDLYLGGKKEEATAAVPDQLADEVALVGPKERIRDRLAAWRESGVTTMICALMQIEALRVLAEIGA